MIQSFADETTRKVWELERAPRLGADVQRAAHRRLQMLDVARTVNDLRVPPGNRLEKLVGDRAGQYSVRVNDQDRRLPLTGGLAMTTPAHDPITPGEILAEEFLGPLGISQYRLAQATGLSQTHIGEIVRGKRRITPDAGLRIARALGVSDRYWIDLQTNYDTLVAKIAHAAELAAIEPIVAA